MNEKKFTILYWIITRFTSFITLLYIIIMCLIALAIGIIFIICAIIPLLILCLIFIIEHLFRYKKLPKIIVDKDKDKENCTDCQNNKNYNEIPKDSLKMNLNIKEFFMNGNCKDCDK